MQNNLTFCNIPPSFKLIAMIRAFNKTYPQNSTLATYVIEVTVEINATIFVKKIVTINVAHINNFSSNFLFDNNSCIKNMIIRSKKSFVIMLG